MGSYKIPMEAGDFCEKVTVAVVAYRHTADNATSAVIMKELVFRRVRKTAHGDY